MALILGWDPGSKQSAWGLLDIDRGARRYVASGLVQNGDAEFAEVFDRAASLRRGDEPIGGCGVETPAGFIHEHARGAQLLMTARVAGTLGRMARAIGVRFVAVSAMEVRRSMCGRGGAGAHGDRAVKGALQMLVREMPRRSNTHERDALLVALFAGLNPARRDV